jgi:hypothetical protein
VRRRERKRQVKGMGARGLEMAQPVAEGRPPTAFRSHPDTQGAGAGMGCYARGDA